MSYTLFTMKTTRARIVHRCIWCGEPIDTGEQYLRERSVYDGNMQNFAWHQECRKSAEDGWDNGDDPEFTAYGGERPKQEA